MTLKQKTLIVTVAGLAAILLSGIAQFWSMNQIDSAWEKYTSKAEIRAVLLADIKAQFGYGGIIHNFKNYVLRGQPKYFDRIDANKKAILADINKYKTLDLTEEEAKALDAIETVMQRYSDQTVIARNMWSENASPAEIDKTVKINDSPAFSGFKTLTEHFTAISDKARQDMNQASRLQFVFFVASFILLSAVIVADRKSVV